MLFCGRCPASCSWLQRHHVQAATDLSTFRPSPKLLKKAKRCALLSSRDLTSLTGFACGCACGGRLPAALWMPSIFVVAEGPTCRSPQMLFPVHALVAQPRAVPFAVYALPSAVPAANSQEAHMFTFFNTSLFQF